ncbi:MAG: tRNA uridine-5-carboxymethylaminomethyl(34) synthesis GTPase MnmE [Candidatus Omnitrophica bacterium]|nr:tRNA uridine-5-carboxymethylaminomethyl(34) synthesis GTPase MnmE [Candidatus Omnitrophota bacterium]
MSKIQIDDTIAAIATPVGEGGISVIRVSGPKAMDVVSKVFRAGKLGEEPVNFLKECPSHTIYLGKIVNDREETIDQVLLSLFKEPHSYTAEDVIEISSHGGFVVTKKILDLLIQHGARHAEPGEFTKRAFLNGKIDLTQAEAVLDLIKAKSEKSLETAVRQLAGELSMKLKGLKDEMMRMYAQLEAFIDFPEEDLEIFDDKIFLSRFEVLEQEIGRLLSSFKRGSLLKEGLSAVIVGKPNVGKSSLFNALLARDRALVSEMPGTTRDALEEAIEIEGVLFRLTDSAGLAPDIHHPLERMGMERTRRVLQDADLVLFVVDGSISLDESDRHVFETIDPEKKRLIVINKKDLPEKVSDQDLKELTKTFDFIRLSTKTRDNFEILESKMVKSFLGDGFGAEGEQITRLRHKNALEKARQSMTRAKTSFENRESLECVVIDLKEALDVLRELIGEVYSEDLLDVIFSEFCIGK